MARIKHTPRKEGIMACTKQTGEDLPASSKRRAATFVVKPNKRPRADVHPIQKDFADRVPDEPGILVAPMDSGKPRKGCARDWVAKLCV